MLHKKLRKLIHTPDFPSKRNPHLRTKPLEQRRQELEDYIQEIIYQNEDVPQVLLDFLHVKHFHTENKVSSLESLDDLDSQDDRTLTSLTAYQVSRMLLWMGFSRGFIHEMFMSASQPPPGTAPPMLIEPETATTSED